MFGKKNLVDDFFKKKLLIRDLKLFFKWNELLSMYRSLEEKKKRGLRSIYGKAAVACCWYFRFMYLS